MLREVGIAALLASVIAAVACGGGSVSTLNTQNHNSPPPPPQTNSSGTISIYPASETLRVGGQRRFSGWDSSVGQYDVTWSLQEGAAAGSITVDGLYTAPSA